MAEEEVVSSEEEVEPVAASEEKVESVAEPETTEQDTEPEPTPEKVYTKAEVDEIMSRRVAREKRKLQRQMEAEQPKAEPVKTKGEPNIDDYEDSTEWIKDHTKFIAEQVAKEERQRYEAQLQAKEAEKVNSAYKKQQNEAANAHPDYWDALDALDDYGEIPAYLNDAVVTSEVSGELSYFLGKNPEELDRLIDLTPTAAVKAIARLEDKITSAKPVKAKSNAPAPQPKMNTGSRVEALEYKKDIPMEDFIKLRNKELGRH